MKKTGKEISKLNFKKQTIVKLNDLQKIIGGNPSTTTQLPPTHHTMPTRVPVTKTGITVK
jgi:hypothetical protein